MAKYLAFIFSLRISIVADVLTTPFDFRTARHINLAEEVFLITTMKCLVCIASRGVTTLARARSKFGTHMFEPEVFGSKCTVLTKVLVTLLGLFGTPRSHLASP